MKTLVILGLTGSIGTSALKCIDTYKDCIKIVGASVHTRTDKAFELCRKAGIKNLCITGVKNPSISEDIKIFHDIDSLIKETQPDIVLNGISTCAGLEATQICLKNKVDIALANKESVVLGGNLLFEEAKKQGVKIIPVDSEHSALDELITVHRKENIKDLIITASGGPFLNRNQNELTDITWQQAAKHPTWKMGPKISIDSATLANKGLEVIEAHYLFGFNAENIKVVIHPQSIVHSMVKTFGGQIYAQLSVPNMVLPIIRALYGRTADRTLTPDLDFTDLSLEFRKPNLEQFPMLRLAFDCVKNGLESCVVFNTANEIAVEQFVKGQLKFTQIPSFTEEALNKISLKKINALEEIQGAIKNIRNVLYP